MLIGNRNPRPAADRRRGAFRPMPEGLEDRAVPTGFTVDLGNVAAAAAPPNGLLGVQLFGGQSSAQAGTDVSYLGDVNGDGLDDFFVSSQTINQAYVVFGSNASSAGLVDWRTLNAQQRTGDLALFGNLNQTNPLNGQPGFNFNGVILTALDSQALLGSSAAGVGDVNGDQIEDFLIGAPNADGGLGRAYLVYGGAQLNNRGSTPVTLDSSPLQLSVAVFANNVTPSGLVTAGNVGAGVSNAGDLIPDGRNDIAIGAPGVSYNGLPSSGAVYVVSGAFLQTSPTGLFNLQTVGQTTAGAVPGLLFTGATPGGQAGFSVAYAGDVDGTVTNGRQAADLLIGAPAGVTGGAGAAYLIYGGNNLAGAVTTVNGFSSIPLGRVGTTGTTGVPGAIFTGATGNLTGFSVSGAGDFNNDGLSDFLIGEPAFGASAGRVTLVYGQSGTPLPITGTIPLGTLPATILAGQFVGGASGDQAGFSVASAGLVGLGAGATPGTDNFADILIGAPGFLANRGTAYLIPGRQGLLPGISLMLSSPLNDPISATQFTTSVPASRLGASVSGRQVPRSAIFPTTRTLDFDLNADFVLGAPGYSIATVSNTRSTAGAVFALEGANIPIGVPAAAGIVTTIGIETPFAPFTLNTTLTTPLSIFVFSTTTFAPVTDINPAQILINGTIPLGPVTVTSAGDLNGDGTPDALLTFSPRSALTALPSGSQTLTVTGTTLASSPLGVQIFTGSATVNVISPTPPPGPTPGPQSGSTVVSPVVFGTAVPLDGEALVPDITSLSRLTYKPLPIGVAYQQFKPTRPFAARLYSFNHPNAFKKYEAGYQHNQRRTATLGEAVFHRSVLQTDGPNYRYTHPTPVIPRYLQSEGSASAFYRRGTKY